MKSKTMSLREVIYYNYIAECFTSKNYTHVKKFAKTLNTPKFTIKKSQAFINSITYRKINDWDSKNMISGSRDNVTAGWRKFSVVDLIKFYIIKDLRKFGLDINKIKNILGNISTFPLTSNTGEKRRKYTFLQLEYFMLSSFFGNKILLLIDEEDNAFFFTEKDAVQEHFYFDEASSPIIMLPFFSYVRAMWKKAKEINVDSTMEEFFKSNITEKERKILDIINKKNYESITIKKQNGEIKTIKAKEILIGDFSDKDLIDAIRKKNYQEVSASVKDGKKVNITREESFKL